MFSNLTDRLQSAFGALRAKGKLTEKDLDAAFREVRIALLEADVHVSVVRSLLARIRERALGTEVSRSLTPGQQVVKIVHEEMAGTLGGSTSPLAMTTPPTVYLLVGLQGSGKTTTSAKLAKRLLAEGRRPMLVAADNQRPAAVEQLETLGARIGVPVFSDRKARPARLASAAVKEARRTGRDLVLVDTAGRLQIDETLMGELREVQEAVDPAEVLLVVDAMTGQDAVNVAAGFQEKVGLTGVILTKLDGDARGGAAISVLEVTGAPVKLAGVGEGLDDLEAFHPERMAARILGMGDVLGLIEKAEKVFDAAEAEQTAWKLEKGAFTLDDFLAQIDQVRRMGPLQDILAMMPGSGSFLRNVEVDERDLRRVQAIIQSMTPEERRSPKIIGGSRKRRIAAGSGTRPQDVNRLLKQFAEAQNMMKMLGRGAPSLQGLLSAQRTKR